jgi:hypothetical protein
MERRMNPAQSVVAKFGGPAALAKLINKGQSTVSYWTKSGTIPAKWQPILLNLAESRSISLSAGDFVSAGNAETPAVAEIPKATHWGTLSLGGAELPAYVLENGQRVFSLKGIVVGLIGTEGGQLTEYLKVRVLRPYLPEDLIPTADGSIPALVRFDTGA